MSFLCPKNWWSVTNHWVSLFCPKNGWPSRSIGYTIFFRVIEDPPPVTIHKSAICAVRSAQTFLNYSPSVRALRCALRAHCAVRRLFCTIHPQFAHCVAHCTDKKYYSPLSSRTVLRTACAGKKVLVPLSSHTALRTAQEKTHSPVSSPLRCVLRREKSIIGGGSYYAVRREKNTLGVGASEKKVLLGGVTAQGERTVGGWSHCAVRRGNIRLGVGVTAQCVGENILLGVGVTAQCGSAVRSEKILLGWSRREKSTISGSHCAVRRGNVRLGGSHCAVRKCKRTVGGGVTAQCASAVRSEKSTIGGGSHCVR